MEMKNEMTFDIRVNAVDVLRKESKKFVKNRQKTKQLKMNCMKAFILGEYATCCKVLVHQEI